MSDLVLNILTIGLALFFFGLLVYGFYIVLFPAKPKEAKAKPPIKHRVSGKMR